MSKPQQIEGGDIGATTNTSDENNNQEHVGPRSERQLSVSGQTLYELLDLPKTASKEEIKKAYRKRALKCHPDKYPNDPEKAEEFKKVNKAHRVLTDEHLRPIYDQMGSVGLQMADELGTDYTEMLLKHNHPCIRFCFCLLFLLTGCCFCCCCLCCCGCCCGKCGPQVRPEQYEEGEARDNDPIFAQPGEQKNQAGTDNDVKTSQPA